MNFKTILCLALIVAFLHSIGLDATSFQGCGIATSMAGKAQKIDTFCSSQLNFWWNWLCTPPAEEADDTCLQGRFIPMIWGVDPNNVKQSAIIGEQFDYLMGYNEPDHYTPSFSAGSFPDDFHCGSSKIADDWQQSVLAFLEKNADGIVVSPAMADSTNTAASHGDYSTCDDAKQIPTDFQADCLGWLECFKQNVIQRDCGRSDCWNVISVIQFHAYYYTAEDLIGKVKKYERAWTEDLNGMNGLSKKTLWITEFARAGTTDPADPDGKGSEFIRDSVHYMKNSPFVSGWSWFSFSNKTFKSFEIDGIKPKDEFWASDLIDDESGQWTQLGKTYLDVCSNDIIAGEADA